MANGLVWLTDADLAQLRRADPMPEVLTTLLDEVQFHRNNLEAMLSNVERHAGWMAKEERVLRYLREWRDGYMLETLT